MRTVQLKPHPLNTAIYGVQEPDDGLTESIRQRGILEPLVVKTDGSIISGHRRWKAALSLGLLEVPCRVVNYTDALEEQQALIEFNRQREKTFSQKMAEAEKLREIEGEKARRRMSEAAQKKGSPTLDNPGRTSEKVAASVGIGGKSTFHKAAKVWEAAKQGNETAQRLMEKLDKKQTTVNAAYKQVLVQEAKKKAIEAIQTLQKHDGKYDVIASDPPWAYEKRAEDVSHRGRCPYPTMTVDEICAMDIPAANNCILWLWTTNAFMHDAFHVLEAWGFAPKTILTWEKDRMGLGDWLRGITEHCIMAIKGRPVVRLTNQTTILHGDLREHSRKPEEFYALVEALCPGRKLEMFARQGREGWDAYGCEADKF